MSELLKNYVNDKRAFSVYDVPKVEKVGIYAIYNRRNKRYYIGSATNIYVRLSSHSVDIRLHGGINLKMAEDINSLQDINDFVFLIIQTFDDNSITLKELRAYERMYIKEFNAATDGYNTDATPYNSGRIKPNTLLSSRKTIGQKKWGIIYIQMPKGKKDEIKAAADQEGKSVNAYIIEAIDEKMSGASSAPPSDPDRQQEQDGS